MLAEKEVEVITQVKVTTQHTWQYKLGKGFTPNLNPIKITRPVLCLDLSTSTRLPCFVPDNHFTFHSSPSCASRAVGDIRVVEKTRNNEFLCVVFGIIK